MAEITVEDIIAAMDKANTRAGRLELENSALQREMLDLSRRIAALTEAKKEEKKVEKN